MKSNASLPPEDPVRPHVFDGIQEYDKRLPNWWLYTLYLTIAFSIGYWSYYEWFRQGLTNEQVLTQRLTAIEATRLAAATVDDPSLWQMSRNAAFVEAGQAVFAGNCAACHLASLRGKSESPTAIGPDLVDKVWIHGDAPTELYAVVKTGVAEKGMPAWGPVLGPKKVAEVVAFILSKHPVQP